MRADQLHPEIRNKIRFFPSPPVQSAWGRMVTRRLLGGMPSARMPSTVRRDIVDFAPGLGVRIFTPVDRRGNGALLHIHGGGMLIGIAAQDDLRCALVAEQLGIVVVSTEYRLAPEHPFPTPLDDCLGSWDWLQAHADHLGIDGAQVAIGGQSAGGGLAASLVQLLHDRGGVQPVAQWLFCPMLDDRTAERRDLDRTKHYIWRNTSNRAGWKAYLGGIEPGAADVPEYASPARRQNLTGLPPCWIGIGDIELFYDEACLYAKQLENAGVEVTLDVVEGAPHAFETIARPAPIARDYLARANTWLGDELVR